MKYPVIENIEQVRAAIAGKEEFFEADRETYIVFNYHVAFEDTFPEPTTRDAELNRDYMIRRECRGLIFDAKTGKCISRPAQKFFNIGERASTQPQNIDFERDHLMLEKLDGSFVRPFKTSDGVLRWGTKMGETDTAALLEPFLKEHPQYVDFAHWACDESLTPMFEFTTRKQRIVIDYPKDSLTLLLMRNNVTGDYIDYEKGV